MVSPPLSDELSYRILTILDESPQISQRALAESLGVSLGKANYCLRAFIATNLVKMRNFKNSENKRAYFYYLTPRGLEEKARVSYRFLRDKMQEYEALAAEIARLNIGNDTKETFRETGGNRNRRMEKR